jgi:hypothetical protein
LARLEKENVSILYKEAKEDAKKIITINEDNTVYETYPYQKKMDKLEIKKRQVTAVLS